MKALITELHDQHETLLARLADVEEEADAARLAQKLQALEAMLTDHLTKEDRQLYPVMRQAAEGDARLQTILDAFAEDLKEVSDRVGRFVKLPVASLEHSELERECRELIELLKVRVRREEELLFSEYLKLAP